MDVIANWNPDNASIPPVHYDSLCHFDYRTEAEYAMNYRQADKPFVVYNVPSLEEVVERWSDLDYLDGRLQGRKYRSETSKDNHFMYWRRVVGAGERFRDRQGRAWTQPTHEEDYTFEEFLKVAVSGHNVELEKRKHVYFRVTAMNRERGDNSWLFDELPFFKPVNQSLFMVDPTKQQGIHCRFGMNSLIAEDHYDGSLNFVAMVSGLRRWILAHPNQCSGMYLLPRAHPSGRHSEVDWSKPDLNTYPKFVEVRVNEVILKPGDVLYVPTSWFHVIESLSINCQCNTRSGRTKTYDADLAKCGFKS